MGQLRIMGGAGDTKLIWDADNDDEVANAKRTYDDLISKGFTAFEVKNDADKGERMRRFDPEAEKVIMVPRMAGG